MSHVPYFWKEKNFTGWRAFVLALMNNTKRPWSLAELREHIAPGNKAAQDKIQGALSGMLSNLKTSGYVDEFKLMPRTTHYVLRSQVSTEQDKSIMLANLKNRLAIKEVPKKVNVPENEVEFKAPHKESNSLINVSGSRIYLTPRGEYYSKRIEEIINVVFKSFDQKLNVPGEWIEEYNELIKLSK